MEMIESYVEDHGQTLVILLLLYIDGTNLKGHLITMLGFDVRWMLNSPTSHQPPILQAKDYPQIKVC